MAMLMPSSSATILGIFLQSTIYFLSLLFSCLISLQLFQFSCFHALPHNMSVPCFLFFEAFPFYSISPFLIHEMSFQTNSPTPSLYIKIVFHLFLKRRMSWIFSFILRKNFFSGSRRSHIFLDFSYHCQQNRNFCVLISMLS